MHEVNLIVALYISVDGALCFVLWPGGSWIAADCKSTLTHDSWWYMLMLRWLTKTVRAVRSWGLDWTAAQRTPSRFSADSVRSSVCFKSGRSFSLCSQTENDAATKLLRHVLLERCYTSFIPRRAVRTSWSPALRHPDTREGDERQHDRFSPV